MDYRKEVAAIAVIDIKAFELEALADKLNISLTDALGQFIQFAAYGDLSIVKNTVDREKAKVWLEWGLLYGEGIKTLIRGLEEDMGVDGFSVIRCHTPEEDLPGLLAVELRYDVTVH